MAKAFLTGNEFKFHDYYSAYNLTNMKPKFINNYEDLTDINF